ncbi:MAG: DUF2259 domain-containing protein [Alphaproteobacteria bacterium]|nr:DUF2259 domain-containing protein [Alphaproteobacteria bacterium]
MSYNSRSANLPRMHYQRTTHAERRDQVQSRSMIFCQLFRVSLFVTGLLCAFASSDNARAAFAAERDIIGFNSTGTVFVFEQFGRQDGSGFPFSELFYISTASNSYAFLPVKRRMDNERKSIKAARNKTRRAAKRLGIDTGGFASPGRLAASDAITEVSPPDDTITFGRFYLPTGDAPKYEITLTEAVSPEARCADLTQGNEKKLKLTLKNLQSQDTKILQDDGSIPASRGCPTDYSISDVVLFDQAGGGTVIVVLINMIRFGFEGPDRFFIAVSGKLN